MRNEEYNEELMKRAKKSGAVTSNDQGEEEIAVNDANEPGTGVRGERLSPLPNESRDFPATRADLGRTGPWYATGETEVQAPESRLPTEVSQSEILSDCLDEVERGFGNRGGLR